MKRTKVIKAKDSYTSVEVTVRITSSRGRESVNEIAENISSNVMTSLTGTPRLNVQLSNISVK